VNKINLVKLKSFLKFLSSLKLAVFVILSIAIITAIGTIVEAKYDAYAAKKLVYDTVWMYGIMSLLSVNLIAVMVDRWPWRIRHLPFLSAHVGIILLLIGSLVTSKFGIDGSLVVPIDGKSNLVTMPETDVVVYATFDGDKYSKVFTQEVDFFMKPPTEDKPFLIPTQSEKIALTKYEKYAIPMRKITESTDASRGGAIRFQLKNPNVNVIEWLVQKRPSEAAKQDFGPAELILLPSISEAPPASVEKNQIYMSISKANKKIDYVIFRRDQMKPFKSGQVTEGEVVQTGWMGLEFKIIRALAHAEEGWDVQVRESPTPLTTAAVKLKFQGNEHWLLLNDIVKLFTDQGAYLVSLQNRRIDLGFPLRLEKFEINHYQGTMKAMEYSSRVQVPDFSGYIISMNEPLKYKGFTFYQSSFQNDPNTNEPIASVFSVNADPGRFLKYLGSLIMSIGIILLFWFKKSFQTAAGQSFLNRHLGQKKETN
jgi:hypothetical protein